MKIQPFKALRPVPELAARIAALPYDVVSETEARAIVSAEPLSFLAVDLPQTTLPEGTDPHSEAAYVRGAELFSALEKSDALILEDEPCFYVYRLADGNTTMYGLVALVDVADYESGIIKRHENTRRDKEDDRVRHIEALGAQTGPIFLAYRDDAGQNGQMLARLVHGAAQGEPLFDFVDAHGVQNTVWRVADVAHIEALMAAARELPAAYIADGHHRSASAARVAAARRHDGERAEAEGLMAVLFGKSELSILPYNRVIKPLEPIDAEQLLALIEEAGFEVTPAAAAVTPIAKGHFGLYLGGTWYELAATDELLERVKDLPVAAQLDVALLQNLILEPLFGIVDPRQDERIEFVGGIAGTKALEERAGTDGVAFSCYATSLDELLSVADAGELMPPKSTWFEPKLRSGLFFHKID